MLLNTLRYVAAATIVGSCALLSPLLACPIKSTELQFASKYTGERVFDDARQVTLRMTVSPDGSGTGKLTLDPNITDGFRSTCIAIREIAVQVTHVVDTEPLRLGTRTYKLQELGEDGKPVVGGQGWLLVHALTRNPDYTLKAINKDGKVTASVRLAAVK